MKTRFRIALFVSISSLLLAACHDHDTLIPPPGGANVTLNMASSSLAVSQRQQFRATVTGLADNSVAWSVDNVAGGNATVGTIDNTGLYTAPASLPSPASVTVKATSAADNAVFGTTTVTLLSAVTVALNLSADNVAVSQQRQFTATVTGAGDNNAVTWTVNDIAGGNATVGTINGTGLYTAPASPPAGGTVTVKATSVADPARSGSATVTIPGGSPPAGVTTLVSVGNNLWNQGNSGSYQAAISADGRFVAFVSAADNLVAGDTNGIQDVFVRDRLKNRTARVNVDSSGAQANNGTGLSNFPAISSNGRFVAFESGSDNLVANDTNGQTDVFVHDRDVRGAGTYDLPGYILTVRASVDSAGVQGIGGSYRPAISGDGRYVAFTTGNALSAGDTNGTFDIYVHDRTTGRTVLVSVDNAGVQGNNISDDARLSADGRFVLFSSGATNLVAGGTPSGWENLYLHDRDVSGSGTFDTPGNIGTVLVNVRTGGTAALGNLVGTSLSANGRYVAFALDSGLLTPVDNNGIGYDVFVRDMATGVNTIMSVSSAGMQGSGANYSPSISATGRYVAFYSQDNTLVPGLVSTSNYQVYVHDRDVNGSGTFDTPGNTRTSLASENNAGIPGNQFSDFPSISGDGRLVAFHSRATNLVAGDVNGVDDIFVRQMP